MRFILGFYRLYFKLIAFVSTKAASRAAIGLFSTPIRKNVRSMETAILQTAEKRKFNSGGNNLAIYTWGNGTKKALLVHGWEGNAGSLGAFVKPLTDMGYEVTALDAPAHGKSEGRQTNFFEYAKALGALIQEIQNIQVLITHSFGSAVSIYALSTHPSIKIEKMVMLTTHDKLKVPFIEFAAFMKLPSKVLDGMYAIVEEKYKVNADDIRVSRLCHEAGVGNVMIIHDRDDKIIPFAYSKKVAESLPGSILVPVQSTGHYKMLWNEGVIKSAMDFIKK